MRIIDTYGSPGANRSMLYVIYIDRNAWAVNAELSLFINPTVSMASQS